MTKTERTKRIEIDAMLDESDPPVIHKTMVLSTVHITPEDCVRLDAMAKDPTTGVMEYEKGYSLSVEFMPSQEDYPMSRLFQSVLAYAARHKCDAVDLDRDGKVMSCLAEFEWETPNPISPQNVE